MNNNILPDPAITQLLTASIELETLKQRYAKLDAQLAMVVNQLDSFVTQFENKFDSDCMQLSYEECKTYLESSVILYNIMGRPEALREQVIKYMFHLATGL
jgi:hypothetical protein